VKRPGIRAKLIRVFTLQVGIISVATLAGIYIANTLIVDLVLREGLRNEAAYFWDRFDRDPSASLPDTSNMRSYMAVDGDLNDVPEAFWDLPSDGVVRTVDEERQLVHVSEQAGHRLYLVWAKAQIYDIAFFFGIVPLAIVLLIIYGLAFLAYRLSQRAISPIVQLAQQLEEYDFDRDRGFALDFEPLRDAADAEVLAMIEALDSFSDRLHAFVERERVFTRDAGHELRTPVAVLKGSLDLLEDRADRALPERNALRRMRQTVDDMEALLETLLMLARESEIEPPREAVLVNDLVARQVELLQAVAARGGNQLSLHEEGELKVRAPPKVIEIVIGNLLRNAANYTRDGRIEATVTRHGVRVTDTGIGMSSDELEKAFEPFYRVDQSRGLTKGHGLGLSIVKRLVRQFGWSISAHSRPGEGTTMEIRF
jgi:signal transduction histidine kinase